MARRIGWRVVAAAGFAAAVGCTSAKSTHYHTDETGKYWVHEKPVHGIPVTLEVPTHLTLSLVKKYHYVPGPNAAPGTFLTIPDGKDRTAALVTYELRDGFLKGKKIFIVDFKRPAAGTFKLGAAIDKDTQYFTNLSHEVNDTTIETIGRQVNELVKNVLPVLGRRTGNEVQQTQAAGLVPIESVVATTVIKIDDPQFEDKVREFLCCAAAAAGLAPCGCDPAGCPTPSAAGR